MSVQAQAPLIPGLALLPLRPADLATALPGQVVRHLFHVFTHPAPQHPSRREMRFIFHFIVSLQ
jgi:hypothetical protein